MKGTIYAAFSDDNGMQAKMVLAYDGTEQSFTVECEALNGGGKINKALKAMVEKIMAQEKPEFE